MSATDPVYSGIQAASVESELGREPTGLCQRESVFLLSLLTLSIGLRLIHITQLFVDAWCWKQLTNAMISRNYYLHGFHFLYPQIDWAGPYPGYIGTELPLVPFLASLLYLLFGIHEWIGRSISVAFFALAVPFFYLFVRKISNERSAMVATAAYCIAPLTFFASRSFQSDMASLSFAVVALYLFSEWLDNPPSKKLFILACAITSLCILLKLPQAIIGVPFLYLCWEKYGIGLFRRKELWAFAVLALIFPLAWELHAYQISVTQYPYHFAGEGGVRIMPWKFYSKLIQQTMTESLTPVLFIGLFAGMLVRQTKTYGRVFHWWFVAFVLFVIFAGRENRHPWVQLPVVPIAAAFSGFAFDAAVRRRANSRAALAGAYLILFTLLSYLSYHYLKPAYKPWQLPSYHAALEVKQMAAPQELIAVADSGDPVVIYYSERRGWHFLTHFGARPKDSAEAIRELENLRREGANYLIFNKYTIWWLDYFMDFGNYLDSRYHRAKESPEYIIYDISRVQPSSKPGQRVATHDNGQGGP